MAAQREIDILNLEVARLRTQLAALAPADREVPKWPVIAEQWDDELARRQYPVKAQPHCRSSSLGEPCLRRLYYERIGEKKKDIDINVNGKFHIGNELEEDAKRAALEGKGWRIEQSQVTFEYFDSDKTLLYRGHPDGLCTHPLYPGRRWVFDIKSAAAGIWQQLPRDPFECARFLERVENKPWLLKYVPQICSYMLSMEQQQEEFDGGILIFVNKDNSRIKCAFVELTTERARWIVRRCRRINNFVESNTIPQYATNPKTCELCPYLKVTCNPAIIVEAQKIVDVRDPSNGVTIKYIDQYLENYDLAKRVEAAADLAKTRFRNKGPGTYIIPGRAKVRVTKSNRVSILPLED